MLFLLGVGYSVATWRTLPSRLLLIWLVVGLIVNGALSKYDRESVSRLIFLMPLVAILAGAAFDRALVLVQWALLRRLHRIELARQVSAAVGLIAVLTAVGFLSLERWFVQASAHVQSTSEAVAMRFVELPRCQTAPRPPIIVSDGIGGAIGPALTGMYSIVQPNWGLYKEPLTWVDTVPTRCVNFRSPGDPGAMTVRNAVAARWPNLRPVVESDYSGRTKVLVYYPASGGSGAD